MCAYFPASKFAATASSPVVSPQLDGIAVTVTVDKTFPEVGVIVCEEADGVTFLVSNTILTAPLPL